MRWNGVIYAAGAIGLGLTGLAFGDFALQWQPVPKGFPAREALSAISAVALLAAGATLLWRRSALYGALALAIMYGLWSFALKTPALIARPLEMVSWLGPAETLAMAAGGLTLAALTLPTGLTEARMRLTARIAFGLCQTIFGLSHFAYAGFTAAMVPAWIPPGGLFWAYATGVAHIAGGLAILSGVQARLAATLLTVMYAGFALLLHAPRVAAAPAAHIEWVMLGIATSICGAAWAIRAGLDPEARPWGFLDRREPAAETP
jgi:uncharacterized membrane protein YphA (DoxX/SURF4 family)